MADYDLTFVCLANSRKISGRCIAGKMMNGAWVRPTSTRGTGELSEYDRRFQDGSDPKLLDVVRVTMLRPAPHHYQTENHLINDGIYWSKVESLTFQQVEALVDDVVEPLWDNSSSSYNGLRDRVPEMQANALTSSLKLIRVDDLQIVVSVEGAEFANGKRKVRGQFHYNGAFYLLSITDPVVERTYLAKPDGTTSLGHALLCISLGEPYNGYAYKLIAGVILP